MFIGLDLPSTKLKQGPIPTLGQLSESEEKHLRLRVKQLICGSLNGMRIRVLAQPYIPQIGTIVLWKALQIGAAVWGAWSDPSVRAAVDCREMD